MNSRWQAGKIGLINFWYYDEQEFPFVKGRMLLRGSNGSGKSVTMQSVVPLLLDGNMSPERLDPFGSRDRKMSSYLLEENDGREERTGYLYLEFKRKDSDIYFTIGMGIRARRGKPLDKWYFSLTDGRRVGKDFFLYKDMGEKVTLSRRELEYRVADGGKVFDRQVEYMDYVNRQIFGFETLDEYKEMLDLLIQLRTPKLSKDFKPSVINDILSDSLQPLSDEDLRPMSEAIENMDTMNMNLKSRREARQAAEKIHVIYHKYNKLLLWDKAEHLLQSEQRLQKTLEEQKQYEEQYRSCCSRIEELDQEIRQINEKKETLEKERESLNKSDAVALKIREMLLTGEIEQNDRNLKDKKRFLAAKEEQCRDAERQIRDEEDRKYRKETELKEILNEMQDEAEQMAFQEFAFMREELVEHLEEGYKFELHRQQFEHTKQKIAEGEELLSRLQLLNRQKEEMIQRRERQIRELDAIQRRLSEWEGALLQAGNEWKEEVFRWNKSNMELKLDHDLLRELASFAENYEEASDFAVIRNKVSAPWIQGNQLISNLLHENRTMYETLDSLLAHLDEDIQELETLIKDGDRELFEDILANTVSRKIRGKINASNTWVQKMNALMDRMDTSSSLKLNLRWRSKTAEKEDQMDTRELVELLKKDYRLMSEEEASRLSSHFRSKVEEARRNARDSGGMISFYQIMKETLDYRKWFEFQLFSQKNGERQKELTNSVFGTFSGGEKAMSMYVPLFSAVVAKYQGGREDAPRLISLDEAFAGVDNRNIRDMFRLMTQFEFDFIINSQVLWGDCDTLDALAIYQLIRPENAKFVTVMPYLWNGSSRELLEDEESVEECASELV